MRLRCLVLAALVAVAPAAAVAQPERIGWSDLRAEDDPECRDWYAVSRSAEICAGVPEDIGYHRCAAQTAGFDGPVEISGYAHPLEIEFTGVTRFLLSASMVPCTHPPAPMGNQIILVEFPDGIDMSFDPVRVTGTLAPAIFLHGMTQARYRLQATRVETVTHPDVID